MEPSVGLESLNQTPSHCVIRETTFCRHWPCNPTENGMNLNRTNEINWFWSTHENPQEVILHLSSSALFLLVFSKQVHTSFLFLVHTNTITLLYTHRTVTTSVQSNSHRTAQHFHNSLKMIRFYFYISCNLIPSMNWIKERWDERNHFGSKCRRL